MAWGELVFDGIWGGELVFEWIGSENQVKWGWGGCSVWEVGVRWKGKCCVWGSGDRLRHGFFVVLGGWSGLG